jgi:hypothetical protein
VTFDTGDLTPVIDILTPDSDRIIVTTTGKTFLCGVPGNAFDVSLVLLHHSYGLEIVVSVIEVLPDPDRFVP